LMRMVYIKYTHGYPLDSPISPQFGDVAKDDFAPPFV
jgi:hypothetical protein